MTITVICPNGGCLGTIDFDVYRENYGADADGRRGIMTTFADNETDTCSEGCELSERDIERAANDAIKEY